MRQALYRKYRSNDFSDIVGQDPIVSTLLSAIKENKISHAYLFNGPRGVGKTSVARIIAHKINNLEYSNEDNHVDIIEIDGASNRGIDEIRDLREKTSIVPTSSTYKVYIIDEVHMLTLYAFNALLKILEEPPTHIVFILATTDINKVPATIISRTQKFTFKQITSDTIVKRLEYICQKEKIDYEKAALEIIAQNSEGSLRDSINMLDQLTSIPRKLTADDVTSLIGLPPESEINNLLDLLLRKKLSINQLFITLDNLYDNGTDFKTLSKTLIIKLKQKLIDNDIEDIGQVIIIKLLKDILIIPGNTINYGDQIKIILADFIAQNTDQVQTQKVPTIRELPKEEKLVVKELKIDEDLNKTKPSRIIEKNSKLDEVWKEVINKLKKSHSTLYSTLMMSQVNFEKDNMIEISFNRKFYADQFNNSKNHDIIFKILTEIHRNDVSIKAIYNKDLELPQRTDQISDIIEISENSQDTDNIQKIFGGAELIKDDSINIG